MSVPWDRLFEPEFLFMLFIFGGGALTGIIALFINAWKQNRERERNAILKQQMIEKGMSADDIVRVIQAKPSKNPATPPEE